MSSGIAALLAVAACAGGATPAAPTTAPKAAAPAGASPTTGGQAAPAAGSPAANPATAASPATAAKAPTGEPIKIYFQFTFTGPTASTGIFFDEGAKVAVQQINSSGGIMGRPIEYQAFDDQAKADVAVRQVREWGAQGVNLIFGGATSAICPAVVPVAQELNLVYQSVGCQSTKMTGEWFNPHFFRSTTNAEITSRASAIVMNQKYPDVTKWATISPDYEYGHNTWEIFVKQMQALNPNFTVVKEAFPPFLSPSFQSYITSVQGAQPEGMFSSLFSGDTVNMIKQAEPFGFTRSLKANITLGDLDTAQALGRQQPDQWITTFWQQDAYDNPEHKRFIEEFKKLYPDKYPSGFHHDGYTGIMVYKAAIEKAGGKTDTASILQAIKGLEVALPVGKMKIRAEDHQAEHPVTIVHVEPDPSSQQGWKITETINVPSSQVLDPPHPGQPGKWG
ncbi:MAG TPA: ABC transporter substrate-binding protein [Dehalococcoidia bacterium]|nr:ABC transporter substrate-binding protein [Dehalococcoidia bacterium]